MKFRLVFKIVLFLLIGGVLCATDTAEFRTLRYFSRGSGANELGYNSFESSGNNPIAPADISVHDSKIYILDNINARIVSLEDNSSIEVVVSDLDPGGQILIKENWMILLGYPSTYKVFDFELHQMIGTGRFTENFRDATFFLRTVLAGDVLLIQPAYQGGLEPVYYSAFLSNEFSGAIRLMDPEKTLEFLAREYTGTEDFVIDEHGYIYWNGLPVTPFGGSFAKYHWDTILPETEWQSAIVHSDFLGWDSSGNSYWTYRNYISVVDSTGNSLAFFQPTNIPLTGSKRFAVSTEGDLYCLLYERNAQQFNLMKLDRFW